MKEKSLPCIPYETVHLKKLMKERRPVKISEFFTTFPEANRLTQENFLQQLGDFPLTAARLHNRVLDLSHPDTFDITTFTARQMQSDKNIFDNFYFSEPISSLPERILKSIPYPLACQKHLWFKGRSWIAGNASRTPLHRDIPHNIILVTEGCKDIILVAPAHSKLIYPNSIFSKVPNFSRVDIRNPDYEIFPELKQVIFFRTSLEAGEMLYIPPFWWHDVRNTGRVTSFNYWFAPPGMLSLLALLSFLAKKISGIYKYEWRKPVKPGAIQS